MLQKIVLSKIKNQNSQHLITFCVQFELVKKSKSVEKN